MPHADLENRLQSASTAEPSPQLRDRVMQTISAELLLTPSPCTQREGWGGGFWLAIAAVVLMAVNLSMIESSRSEFPNPAPDAGQMSADLQALRQFTAAQEGTLR